MAKRGNRLLQPIFRLTALLIWLKWQFATVKTDCFTCFANLTCLFAIFSMKRIDNLGKFSETVWKGKINHLK